MQYDCFTFWKLNTLHWQQGGQEFCPKNYHIAAKLIFGDVITSYRLGSKTVKGKITLFFGNWVESRHDIIINFYFCYSLFYKHKDEYNNFQFLSHLFSNSYSTTYVVQIFHIDVDSLTAMANKYGLRSWNVYRALTGTLSVVRALQVHGVFYSIWLYKLCQDRLKFFSHVPARKEHG